MSLKRFSTFEGVFTPCLLSILGVIMYLRLGWVVGETGFWGALAIIFLANLITLATALSMSSVVTNIRIGAGGAYSIISKSLGVEAGGAIGIPLYISQSISVAFYITGFTECWRFVFPHHNILLVSLIVWFLLFVITFVSTKLAFRIQYGIMALIFLSVVSIVLGEGTIQQPLIQHTFKIDHFWGVFAVFFPAATGILAGASLSGEMIDPKKSIPKGTLWAIGVSFLVYVFLAYLFAIKVPVYELKTNFTIAIDMGRWPLLVIAGIMGATLSSALNMFIGSPRVLVALGKHNILPFSKGLMHFNKKGEPTTAILFTGLIVFFTLLLGSLNQIAVLLTMFFLITYGIINLTVFIEETMGIISFRPTFRISKLIPFMGAISCVIVMFLVDAQFSIIAILVITGIYFALLNRESQIYSPDIRSGMLVFMAEQFAKLASRLPYYPKIWKPNLLVPVDHIEKFQDIIPFICAVVSPSGRVTAYKVISLNETKQSIFKDNLDAAVQPLKDEGIFVETSVVEAHDPYSGNITVMQTVRGLFFPPNSLFYMLDEEGRKDDLAEKIIEKATLEGLGIIILNRYEHQEFGNERVVNLWVRRQSPNINLSILIALQLERNWDGMGRLIQVVEHESERLDAEMYLNKLKELMRLPIKIEIEVLVGNFKDISKSAPPADINIFGLQEVPNIAMIREVTQNVKTSVLFLRDSKNESAMA